MELSGAVVVAGGQSARLIVSCNGWRGGVTIHDELKSLSSMSTSAISLSFSSLGLNPGSCYNNSLPLRKQAMSGFRSLYYVTATSGRRISSFPQQSLRRTKFRRAAANFALNKTAAENSGSVTEDSAIQEQDSLAEADQVTLLNPKPQDSLAEVDEGTLNPKPEDSLAEVDEGTLNPKPEVAAAAASQTHHQKVIEEDEVGEGTLNPKPEVAAAAAETHHQKVTEEEEEEEVTEVLLRGEDTKVREIGNSLYSFKTLKKLVFKLGEGGKQFVVNSVGGVLRMGKKSEEDSEPEFLAFGTSMYENKVDGVSALEQWTATEMTMQHAQLVRIERDVNYLVFAFSFFGFVRICEAFVHAFSMHPPKLKRLMQASNAMDPLTVAWLAYNLRKPIAGMLRADPKDLQTLVHLRRKLWAELHAFFERQWKVMATISMARFLSLIASKIPTSQWITGKVKLAWDMLMALPIF